MDISSFLTSPSPISSHISKFTPLNSPEGQKIDETSSATKNNYETDVDMDDDNQLQASSKAEVEENGHVDENTTPSKPSASAKKATPSKRRSASTTNTPTKKPKKDTTGADNEDGGPGSAAGTPTRATLPSIPSTLAAAGEGDKLILRLRDAGKGWAEINKSFFETTGIKVGQSTLRMRYTTMKGHFAGFDEADEPRLMRFKKEIEDKFETEKWTRISEAIVGDGGGKYASPALQRKFKELKAKQAASSAANDNDGDEE
ncbi:hypothetical protein BDV06DRAFT_224377 [Aspergillus oleicola]